MSFVELLLLAVSLAMDAFAVSVCKGLAVKKPRLSHAALCGLYFGFFQFLMPCIGYFITSSFERYVQRFNYWIAFAVLAFIGINMIRESFDEQKEADASFSVPTMLLLAVATSIDALAAGVSFAVLSAKLLGPALVIGAVTFVIAGAGVFIGGVVGNRFSGNAERLGGAVLICLGIKILLTGLL